jgi:hypothetical protein
MKTILSLILITVSVSGFAKDKSSNASPDQSNQSAIADQDQTESSAAEELADQDQVAVPNVGVKQKAWFP